MYKDYEIKLNAILDKHKGVQKVELGLVQDLIKETSKVSSIDLSLLIKFRFFLQRNPLEIRLLIIPTENPSERRSFCHAPFPEERRKFSNSSCRLESSSF